jgi:hypothetical protein
MWLLWWGEHTPNQRGGKQATGAYNSSAIMSFVDALRAVNSLKDLGLIDDYAVAGAMAIVFWTEPVPTYDLDVLVVLPRQPGELVSLDSIYRWAAQQGYPATEEHLLVHGVPTQFLPSPNRLSDEAIRSAIETEYEGTRVRVVPPEYLIALYLEPPARTARRRERAAMLMELPSLDHARLREIMERHGLTF